MCWVESEPSSLFTAFSSLAATYKLKNMDQRFVVQRANSRLEQSEASLDCGGLERFLNYPDPMQIRNLLDLGAIIIFST